MVMGDAFDRARAAIDAIGGESYVIEPAGHAAALATSAPELAAVLGSSEVRVAADAYKRDDGAAIAARDDFKGTARRANLWVLAATVLSTVLVWLGVAVTPTPSGPLPAAPDSARHAGPPGLHYAFVVFPIAFIVTGLVARYYLTELKQKDLLKAFREARAEAERRRRDYFERVTSAGTPTPALLLAQLAYFNRFQLETQCLYYLARGRDHTGAADRKLDWVNRATLFTSGVALVGGFLAVIDPRLAAIAALGAVGSAGALYFTTSEAIDQDRANARRYKAALVPLDDARSKLDAVAQAAAAGDRRPMLDLVAEVHKAMAAEHSEWLVSDQQIEGAMKGLDQALARPAQPRPPAGPPPT